MARVPLPKVPASDLWSKLDALHAEISDLPADAGFTPDEYAKRYGGSRRRAQDVLGKWLSDGKIKVIGKRGRARVFDVA